MNTHTLKQAADLAYLHKKWIGDGPADIDAVCRSIKREIDAAKAGRIPVTTGLLREMRAEQTVAGRIRIQTKGA